jgi:ribosomal protein S18 acetylase RimI-like enzyme
VSGPERVTLRPAREEDEEFLIAVYASTRADELAQTPWSPEQKDAFVRLQFAAQKQHYAGEYPDAAHDVICREEVPVGRLYVATKADALHILDITVLPQHRHGGIASYLVRQIMDQAAKSGRSVTIYVETFNPSLGLFRKLGFQPVAETGFHMLLQWTRS